MEYSDTYLEILEEGAAKEARRFLLLLGSDRFGQPDPATRVALEAITNPKRLEQLGRRMLRVSSWQELLAKPTTQRRRRLPNRKS